MASIDFKTVFDAPELLALGQGRLQVTAFTKSAPERAIVGTVVPKFSCDFFDSVLSPLTSDDQASAADNDNDDDDEQILSSSDSNAKGLAWMFMDTAAQIHYHIK